MGLGLDLATRIAFANEDYPKWRMGAVLVKGGSVQAVGWNVLKSDPAFLDDHSNCSIHAEISALRQVRFRAKNHVLYIARVTRSGLIGMAKPCCSCQEVIRGSGVRRVRYTINQNTSGVWRP